MDDLERQVAEAMMTIHGSGAVANAEAQRIAAALRATAARQAINDGYGACVPRCNADAIAAGLAALKGGDDG